MRKQAIRIILMILLVFIVMLGADLISIENYNKPLIVFNKTKDDCGCTHYRGFFYYTNLCEHNGKAEITMHKIKCIRNNMDVAKKFIRTYKIENVENSHIKGKIFLTLTPFQEKSKTILIDSLDQELKIGSYYEFEFIRYGEVEDMIQIIFETCDIISIRETTKTCLDQIQDPI